MTNEEKEQSGQIPPKIQLKKVNGNGEDAASPPKAKPISGPKSDTSRIDLSDADVEKLDRPTPTYDETMRVVLPKSDDLETGTLRKKTSDKPQKTIKIKRPSMSAEPAGADAADDSVAKAKPVSRPSEDTSRIDLSKAQMPPSQEQMEVAKQDTMRVILDEMSGGSPAEQTGKPLRTIKIKRDAKSAPEMDTAVGGFDDQKDTVVGSTDAEKSETAKLDLPDAATQTRGAKKTIVIKRAGADSAAGQGRTLKISRPSSVAAPALSTMAESGRPDEFQVAESHPHAIFTIAAMLTVIISGVLIYLMCTHMPFGDSLPWYGKIITEWQGSTSLF